MSAAAEQKTSEPSMEEILASIRRIISDDQQPLAPISVAPAIVAPVAVVSPPAPAYSFITPEPLKPAYVEPIVEELEEEDVLELVMPEPVKPAGQIVEKPYVAPIIPMQEIVQHDIETTDRLIAGQTDTIVSNAFGSLANTVMSNNSRTIDDVVKDMLKPMLKSWLDENLPSIVERLVRSEIERVARGGR